MIRMIDALSIVIHNDLVAVLVGLVMAAAAICITLDLFSGHQGKGSK